MTFSRFNAGTFRETFEATRGDIGDLRPDEFHLNVAQTSAHYYGNADDEISASRDALAEISQLIAVTCRRCTRFPR